MNDRKVVDQIKAQNNSSTDSSFNEDKDFIFEFDELEREV